MKPQQGRAYNPDIDPEFNNANNQFTVGGISNSGISSLSQEPSRNMTSFSRGVPVQSFSPARKSTGAGQAQQSPAGCRPWINQLMLTSTGLLQLDRNDIL